VYICNSFTSLWSALERFKPTLPWIKAKHAFAQSVLALRPTALTLCIVRLQDEEASCRQHWQPGLSAHYPLPQHPLLASDP
jgi:hypothetical protein